VLLYNNKQEFIGIDDEGLRLLNYSSLEELLSVCSDVADLFANEPGYIHNFKNFGWIDFLLHADSDASSAIVHGNGRTFSCRLSVTAFHLCAQPAQSGYSIEMSQIKSISGEEFKAHVITPKAPAPEFIPPSQPIVQSVPTTPFPDYTHLTPTQLSEPSTFDIPTTQPTSLDDTDDIYASLMAPLSDSELDTFTQDHIEEAKEEVEVAKQTSAPTLSEAMLASTQYSASEQDYLSHHKVQDSYIYDPSVAANELGLPVDLIEEFIGDFIQQSHEFKDELFEAATKSDFNTLHILSHKLKGVAANLRVENAFETLTVINSSTEPLEIEANLKYYYEIIAKLEGKEAPSAPATAAQTLPVKKEETKPTEAISLEALDDIYAFSLKQGDNESLLVSHDDIDEISIEVTEETVPFKKEFFELNDEADEEADEEELVQQAPEAESEDVKEIEEAEEIVLAPLHYDLKAVAGALGMEPSFMEELLHDYKTDAAAMSVTIIQAIKSFDTHAWKSSAAKLKGISDNLRLSEISDELAILSITNDAQEAKKSFLRLTGYLDQL
jgi:HPt (histidine-containing phosphotransfer) domain-containing protein